ncbi:FAD-binding protein [Spelaeicoccus albus]|uniref:Xylitol oxidase n=1 Tax=Spelaeicoccus albus TaxID=1280376 RepID=A0A7Z0ACM2_9MICO|nr:FAD-binding protein [Spelaeicoccus albus]NYI67318.1 xylitol oxidase [Spelaeicoccus albus]
MDTNWGGTVKYAAARRDYPETPDALRELVRGARHVKALGSRHSFNGIADTSGVQISLERMRTKIEIDEVGRAVSVSGGVRYGELAAALHERGLALANLASLPHVTVAGACATGTHGSGSTQPPLSDAVRSIDLVTADGDLVRIGADDPELAGAVVNLGLLGVVTRLTLDVVPAFDVCQHVFLDLPRKIACESFDGVMASGYSVSLMTDWSGDAFSRLWVKSVSSTAVESFGARAASIPVHPVAGAPAEGCTEQLGVPGAWHYRLPHFRPDFTPSSGREIQTEYLLPRRYAPDAISALERLGPRLANVLFVSEVRTVAADRQWMSPAHGRDSAAFHFTWRPDADAVAAVLPALDDVLRPFGARPHLGKAFHVRPGQIADLYPRFADFLALREQLDPRGKFDNQFARALFG